MGCYKSCVVNAPVEKVWEALRNFHDLSWAEGVIESVDKIGDKASDQTGARRILNGAFHETLLGVNDKERSFKYSLDDGPDAVSRDNVQGYIGAARVWPVTDVNATFVEWSSSWASGGEGTKEFCDPIYHALLGALKIHFS